MASKTMKMADVMKMERAAKKALAEDTKAQLEASTKAQGEKLTQSMEHLKGQLTVAAEKYRTVNGYMQARSTIHQAIFGEKFFTTDGEAINFNDLAREIALEMSDLAATMAEELERIDVMDLNEHFLESNVDFEFVLEHQSIADIVRQLLVVNLLQNVGPSVDDIINFRDMTNAEIAKLTETTEE